MTTTTTETKPEVTSKQIAEAAQLALCEMFLLLKNPEESAVYACHRLWKEKLQGKYASFGDWLKGIGDSMETNFKTLCDTPADVHLKQKWILTHLNPKPGHSPTMVKAISEILRDHERQGAGPMLKSFKETTRDMSRARVLDFYKNLAD